MDKETKRTLFLEIISRVPLIKATRRNEIVDSLMAIEEMPVEEIAKKVEETNLAEKKVLETKIAEAEATIAEARPQLEAIITTLNIK
jgi:hypothetical protein